MIAPSLPTQGRRSATLTDAAKTILTERYLRKNDKGQVIETPEELFWRVAWDVAQAEIAYGADEQEVYESACQFYDLMIDRKFLPNSPTLMNAGTGNGFGYNACYVLGIDDSLPSIFNTIRDAAIIHQQAGGTGFSFSSLRQAGSMVRSTHGVASGPVSFLKVYDAATQSIIQGGCFIGSTLIATADGPVPIKNIKAGTLVYAWDGEMKIVPSTDSWQTRRNAEVWKLTTDKGLTVYATPDHPFLARSASVDNKEYVKLCDLIPGFSLMPFSPEYEELKNEKLEYAGVRNHKVVDIKFSHYEDVYNVEVPGPNNYVVCDEQMRGVVVSNTRRGANMGVLAVSHPDITSFIHAKDDGGILNFNISVGITDAFMEALDGRYLTGENSQFYSEGGRYHGFDLIDPGTGKVTSTVDARTIWRELVESAHKTGDPGIIFLDEVNRSRANPCPSVEKIEATNPCLFAETRLITSRGVLSVEALAELSTKNKTFSVWTPAGWQQSRVWKTGDKDVVQVVLSNGQRISLTPDHRIVVGEVWKEAGDILDEKITPMPGPGHWEGDQSFDHATLTKLGFIQGDGSFRQDTRGIAVNLGKNDGEVDQIFSEFQKHGDRVRYINVDSTLVEESERLGMHRAILPERTLPSEIWKLDSESVCAFLRGLYSANGSVIEKAGRVMLKSTSRKLVEEVQLLLLALGLRSYLTTNRPATIEWPNGTFTGRESYDLNLSRSEALKFGERIGFIQSYKSNRINNLRVSKKAGRSRTRVIAVEPVGTGAVYDFAVEEPHAGWANGVCVHNCGEIPLAPYEVCNLASINVGAFVREGNEPWFDEYAFMDTARIVLRFLDNVVDRSPYPLPQIAEKAQRRRRTGLGVMGVADALIALGIPYGSEEGIAWGERVMMLLDTTADQTSLELGKRRGVFLDWEQSRYFPDLPFRNSNRTCVAPTGTISLIAGCSSGIEPLFALAYRHKAPGQNRLLTVVNQTVKEKLTELGFWSDELADQIAEHGSLDFPDCPVPEHIRPIFATAHEISPKHHVLMQAGVQRWNSQATSKTINLTNDATVEDVEKAYRLAWKNGCLGVTVFRDGCKGYENQVLLRGTSEPSESTTSLITPPRPRVLSGQTIQVQAPEGKVNVTLNTDERGLVEVFVNVGKAGSDTAAFAEALGRTISHSLQTPTNLDNRVRVRELAKQLRGIGGSRSIGFGPNQVRSIPDAIAVALEEYLVPTDMLSLEEQSAEIAHEIHTGNLCPDCHNSSVIMAEGCRKCPICGWSAC